MVDVNIEGDLEQVSTQVTQLVEQLTKINTEREQITQQIHNLNGISMYLRGKQQEPGNIGEPVTKIEHEYPPNEGEDA